ncbi:MAG: type II toxin-antitoxin system RelE/ParE family toxin [Deltaproteobacteria bacterium]|nr:type II toxin-antitoxin system RelE/ParE family toxin [Deltaproteobacteria bacterium]MBT4525993.1 type II toxin-antitoxin system RelE/ParE family toxin [Deltaproteobacteria bacterium]
MKIRFLKSAMSDMLEIKQYISIDNPIAAKRLIKKFKEKTLQLRQHPFSGRVLPETKESHLRDLIVSNYRIMYQVSDPYINVFVVYESHRLFK